MFDDPDTVLFSFWLMVMSAAAFGTALFLYARVRRWADVVIWSWPVKSDIEWTGKGFESEEVVERVAQVRRDYVGALHARPHPQFHSRALLSAASQMVRASSYWQRASSTQTSEELLESMSKNPAEK